MKRLLATLITFYSLQCFAQTYQPTWESLDKRPVPQWFTDAKFGIFIHWGVYAVPGWSSKGQYAEWYQQGLQNNDTARQKFHAGAAPDGVVDLRQQHRALGQAGGRIQRLVAKAQRTAATAACVNVLMCV